MKTTTILTTFASLAAAICNHGTTFSPRSADVVKRSEGVFGYHGLDGPLNWHGLNNGNSKCATGTQQSPININTDVGRELPWVQGDSFDLSVDPYPSGAELENLGTTIQVYVNGSATVYEKDYALKQFHFHTPSEHHFDGKYYDAEVHFVFQAADKSLSVIAFMIEILVDHWATESPVFTSIFTDHELPKAGDIDNTAPLDFSSLVKHLKSSKVYQYGGSLTTPPCDEGVTFNVVQEPLYMSHVHHRTLRNAVKFNSRYIQNNPGGKNLLENALKFLQ